MGRKIKIKSKIKSEAVWWLVCFGRFCILTTLWVWAVEQSLLAMAVDQLHTC